MGPSSGVVSLKVVLKLNTEPVAKLATPCTLGPIRRMPAARAVASMPSWMRLPSAPISPKPEATTTATLTPRAAQAATASTAAWPGTATMASSGASGVAASSR